VTLTRHRKLILLVAAAAAAGCVLFWVTVPAFEPKVQLRCLYLTNDVVLGDKEGIFELQNGTRHSIRTKGGPFEGGGWRWRVLWASDAFRQRLFLSPGGVGTFRICVPERGGPYRLVLYYEQVPPKPSRFGFLLRWRLIGFLDSRLDGTIAYKLRARLWGDSIVQSQPFRVTDGPPIRLEDIPVVGAARY
jgi:hypothetical protein